MDHDLQLISDGDGLAVIGNPADVERFLASEGLPSKDLAMQRLGSIVQTGSGIADAGSQILAGSGRWVQLTEESAQKVKAFGLMKSSETGLSLGVVQAKGGQIKGIVQFAKGPGSLVGNPAVLASAAGIMSQMAMQQTMDEITDYLAVIDEKIDDILRAQKDTVVADMIGVDLVIEEAMTVRDQVGRVSEVTWSKVQATSATIARTQAYALRQLDALAEKLENKTKIVDLAKAAKEAESTVHEWVAVLARCFQLQDAISVLELDRVLDASPNELDRHRLGTKAARQKRLDLIARSTVQLLARLDAAADRANAKVLLHPKPSHAVVDSSNNVATVIGDFHQRLGIASDRESLKGKRWVDAVLEVRDKALETGADGVVAARNLGEEGIDRVLKIGADASSSLAGRLEKARAGRGSTAQPKNLPAVAGSEGGDDATETADHDCGGALA